MRRPFEEYNALSQADRDLIDDCINRALLGVTDCHVTVNKPFDPVNMHFKGIDDLPAAPGWQVVLVNFFLLITGFSVKSSGQIDFSVVRCLLVGGILAVIIAAIV